MKSENVQDILTLAGKFLRSLRMGRHGRHQSHGRAFTRDAAFTFRMGAGFPGDVNRSHPMTIEPALNDVTNPVLAYGLACLADAAAPNAVRSILATDSGITAIYGVAVRPFPIQGTAATAQPFGAAGFGATQGPAAQLPIDVLKGGYIMVQLNGATAAVKGGQVYVYVAASGGGHVQGGFEAAAGANLIDLDATGSRIYFNGPADATGIVELVFNP